MEWTEQFYRVILAKSSLACSLYFINNIYFLFKIGLKKKYWCECVSKGLFVLQASGTWVLKILPSHNILGDGIYTETDALTSSARWRFLICLKFWVCSTQWDTDSLKFGTKLVVDTFVLKEKALNVYIYMCNCVWKRNSHVASIKIQEYCGHRCFFFWGSVNILQFELQCPSVLLRVT